MRIRLTFIFLLFSTSALAQPSPITGPGGTQDVNLTQVNGSSVSLGQKTSANSIPVVLPSDQTLTLTIGASVTADTELANAATLADNTATPTAPAVGSFGMVFDGSTWDFMRGDSTNGVLVNLGANNDITGTVTANAGTNLNTSALCLEAGNLATLAAKDFCTQTTLAAMNAKFVTGTDIGDVTINNASGASAVNIQDGGNVITMDGSGTAGTPAGGLLTVQGVASMTPVQVSQATGTNLHAVLDTTSTTAVTQATGTNLHAVVDSGSITATQATGTNLHTVLDSGTLTSITNAVTVNAHAVTVASGGIASGAIASGAVASGAIASGALASGSIAAGAIAAGATSIADNEDVAFGEADRLVKMAAVRDDTLNIRSGTEGDYEPLHLDSNGGLWVNSVEAFALDTSVDGIEALIGTTNTNTGNSTTALQIIDDWDNGASDGASVSGDTAHDTADAGEPVKIGGKAIDYEPDTEDVQGQTDVAANDRTNSAHNLKGEQIEGVNAMYRLLDGTFPGNGSVGDGINGIYDDSPTASTSEAYEVWNYRKCTFSYELDITSSPTDMLFEAYVSLDGTNFAKLDNDFWGDLRESAATITVSGIEKAITFDVAWRSMRIKATATGTSSTNKITVANAVLFCRN